MKTPLPIVTIGLTIICGCTSTSETARTTLGIDEEEQAHYMADIVKSSGAPCAKTFLLLRKHKTDAVPVILKAYDRHPGEDGVPIRCGILSGAWHYNPTLTNARVYEILQRGINDPSPKVQSDAKGWIEFSQNSQTRRTPNHERVSGRRSAP
jgi:hypothetical protein